MNYRMTRYFLGSMGLVLAAALSIPFFIALFGGEKGTTFAFGIVILGLLALGIPNAFFKPKHRELNAKGGLIMVALMWVMMAVVGALPFVISGHIPDFIDALFETVSGFTTTGSTVVTNVEGLPMSLNFWRCFTHWIGGMGVLVLVIALLPKLDTSTVHLMKAEVPGPQFGKLVSKLRFTARILYGIYFALTIIQIIVLLIAGMPFFDAVIHSLATAGTGGFSNQALSIGAYNSPAINVIITFFMLLFSVNFNLFYFVLIGHLRDAVKSEEFRFMISVFLGATAIVTLSLLINNVYGFWDALMHGAFQVSSVISTTGFATADFTTWPVLAQIVLFFLMFMGGSAGSTAGGLKVYRVAVLSKLGINAMRKTSNPRAYLAVRMDGKVLDDSFVRNICTYFMIYIIIFIGSVLLISLETGWSPLPEKSMITDITAVATCFNNVGPGLAKVGPMGSFANYGAFSKIILIFDMLLGRLEIFPILMLFNPRAWKKSIR